MAADWVLVPALVAFRGELNATCPNRDKRTDGTKGDPAHAARPSGHNPDETGQPEDHDEDNVNEVRAADFDHDLNRPGLTMEMIVQFLVRECRAGRITWIKYIIYRRRIWTASGGWVTQAYNGTASHDTWVHISCKPDTRHENNTRPVGLARLAEGDDMTQTEFTQFLERALQDPDVANRFRALAWSYTGGGIPAGKNTLNVLDGIRQDVEALSTAVPPALAGVLSAVMQVDEEVVTAMGAGDLPIADVAAILRGLLGAERAAELGAALTDGSVTS